MRRLGGVVASAAHPTSPAADTWVSVALTYHGLEALGVPQDSLDSFAWEFRQGMAARAKALGDTGESSPEHWETPLGTSDVHVVLTALVAGPRRSSKPRSSAPARPCASFRASRRSGARTATRCPPAESPSDSGTASAIPPIEGSGIPGSNPHEQPFKAGEFVLGYPDETGGFPPMPRPDVLGRNGTYVVFRKLHQRVAAFRRYLKENASSPDDEELLAAKMMGRWRSGAPLALLPVPRRPGARRRSAAQQRLRVRGRRDRVQDAARLAHPARESARCVRGRRRPAPPDDPPRDRVRARASRGRPRGRRRRSRA